MELFFVCKKCGKRNHVPYDGKGGTFTCVHCGEKRTFEGTKKPEPKK